MRNDIQSGDDFERRHIGPQASDVTAMLGAIGVSSIGELIDETVPASIRQRTETDLPPALSETQALGKLRGIASKNEVFTSLIGQGYHGTVVPTVIQRNILENPAWYTAYTPYQPEISQGRLEALLNFQTLVANLTGLDVANASLLDEGTAAAEAMALARRSNRSGTAFFVDDQVHPQTLAVLRTRAEPLGWQLVVGDPESDIEGKSLFGALIQYPGTLGNVRDLGPIVAKIHAAGGLAVIAADPLALCILKSPGECGADIAVGSMQRFGVPMGYGGPHAGYMAVTDALKRHIPGRLVGVSVDARGNPAYRLALQTREQHIRREKATSNICTAQALLAIMASMYAVYHGPSGLRAIAAKVHGLTAKLAQNLKARGYAPKFDVYFDTLTVPVGGQLKRLLEKAATERLNFRVVQATGSEGQAALGIALDETSTAETVAAVLRVFGVEGSPAMRNDATAIPGHLLRSSGYLEHPVFNRYHSETEMLRYMRRLADRDLALDRAMIPLGSCTMKLNATSEMLPVTWPEFGDIHPYAPMDQTAGYRQLFAELESQLCEITGYDAISLQPNSGAQGEFAGLLAIKAYHDSRGDHDRKVCLIPSSAHGTNPASAQLVGMEVVVVACDAAGNVLVSDLREKAELHASRLAAVMVTYPSTHGVFEESIREICDIVHANGGQVYIDGANMNAQVGITRPGDYGGDVSHLNLHKTFCIPHGGGGPGMGPIGVKAHLAPFLPGHPELDGGSSPVGPVSAAAWGSASLLPISYMYILMMGGDGLRRASETAILSANYIAKRLQPHFPVLYTNDKGRVAHECIIDPRAFKESAGVTVEDIAKRLIDYGFHAPTMSFPVPGTLMIEPTESESLAEIDRFIEALICIRREIDDVIAGRWPVEASPLRNAPHTVHDLADELTVRAYPRALGCFPVPALRADKYWSPVGRVDNVHGDRNLVCSCPPLEDYAIAAE